MGSLFKRYIWIGVLLAILVTAFLSAKITSVFIASQFPDQAIGGAKGGAQVVALADSERAPVDVDAVIKRNFFDPSEVATPVSTDTAAPVEEVETVSDDPNSAVATRTSLSVKLLSTVSVGDGRNSLSSAVLESGRAADVYFVNGKESFAPSTKITRILPKRVEFLNGGKLEFVELEDVTKTMAVARTERPTSPTSKKITQEEDTPADIQAEGDKFTIPRAEVDKALQNLPKLYTDIRAVPYFKDGKANGMKLLSVKSGSLFEKLGLKRGDILKSINGNTLDIQSGLQLFNNLKNESNFTLDIERRGAEKALSYDII